MDPQELVSNTWTDSAAYVRECRGTKQAVAFPNTEMDQPRAFCK